MAPDKHLDEVIGWVTGEQSVQWGMEGGEINLKIEVVRTRVSKRKNLSRGAPTAALDVA